jgi:hypothetical protein
MLDELDVFETRVRERAFQLWHEAGCPENAADEFWHRARAIEMKELNLTERDLKKVRAEQAAAPPDADDFA